MSQEHDNTLEQHNSLTQRLAYPEAPLSDGDVSLRPWRFDDLPLVERAARDDELLSGTTLPRGYNVEAGRAFVERQLGRARTGEGLSLVITRGVEPVGCATLMMRRPSIVDLGYWLLEEARGSGTGSRAVAQLVEWALQQPSIDSVEAFVGDENVASQRLLEKAGFIYAGRDQHQVNDLDLELRVYRKDRPELGESRGDSPTLVASLAVSRPARLVAEKARQGLRGV